MSVNQGRANTKPQPIDVVLIASGPYIETMSLKPIEAIPGLTELVISTQLLNAKHPEEKRIKAKCFVNREQVIVLRDAVDQFLIATASTDTSLKANDPRLNAHGDLTT